MAALAPAPLAAPELIAAEVPAADLEALRILAALAEATPAAGVLVIGYGNPLCSDDGVGPVVAAALARDPRLAGADIRATYQLTPELAFDASSARLLVLVDAAEGVAPGEIVLGSVAGGPATGGDAPVGLRPPLSHHIDPAALVALSAELWGVAPPVVLVGIGPASFEVGESLSDVVAAAVPRAVEAVVAAVELAAADGRG
jgi:hydrogenase maturation protease